MFKYQMTVYLDRQEDTGGFVTITFPADSWVVNEGNFIEFFNEGIQTYVFNSDYVVYWKVKK